MKDLIIVIFGSTGDLTFRKLLPAIARLFKKNQLPVETKVIALGRKKYSTEQYLESMGTLSSKKLDIKTLTKIVTYHQMEITDINQYQELIDLVNSEKNDQTRELYYLAIGPELFPDVSNHINVSGLVTIGNLNQSIIFEKPFGHDLFSAKAINEMLWNYFDEKQIYRIDHYLGKEMIQNIMMVRFANRIFEEVWHNRTIKSVKIISKERMAF